MTRILKFATLLFGFIFLLGCTKDDSTSSNENEITLFVFEAEKNDLLEKDYRGDILGTTITVRLPDGTELKPLTPSIEVSDKASVTRKSGDPQDFTDAVTYTVIAEDGSSQDYTVIVSSSISLRAVSYYEGGNRIGAGDFEKPDLFEISDFIEDGDYLYTLKIAGEDAGGGTVTATEGTGTIGGLPISKWASIGDGPITIQLAISPVDGDSNESDHDITKEQYSIRSWQDLQGMQYDLSGAYELMNDIELPDPSQAGGDFPEELPEEGFLPIGENQTDGKFSGVFDGGGYVIRNLFIKRTSINFVGLFGYASGDASNNAVIKDVGIEISKDSITGGLYTGGLAGSTDYVTITNCYVKGDVKGKDKVGGLLGDNAFTSTITSCYATGSVTGVTDVGGLVGYFNADTITNSYATGSVTGDKNVGGLVGRKGGRSEMTITNCYATGSVTGGSDGRVGGLVGYSSSGDKITNCYATGNVNAPDGADYVGGLVGYNYEDITTDINSYWDIASTGQSGSAGGTGVSSGDYLVKDGEEYIDKEEDGNGTTNVFVDWAISDDDTKTWKWLDDGQWPVLN